MHDTSNFRRILLDNEIDAEVIPVTEGDRGGQEANPQKNEYGKLLAPAESVVEHVARDHLNADADA